MIDVLGFWFAITMMIAPLFLACWYFVEWIIDTEVKSISNERFGFRPFGNLWHCKVWDPACRSDNEPFLFLGCLVVILASVACLFFAACAVDCDTGESLPFLQGLSSVAIMMTPVTSIPAVLTLIVSGYILLIRKPLVKLFQLQEKIEKL